MLGFLTPLKALKPVRDHDAYSDPVEDELIDALRISIFLPLLRIVRAETFPEVRAAARASAVAAALRANRIQYMEGFFYGDFNAAIGKELRLLGATFNKTKKAYALAPAKIPIEIKQALADGRLLSQEKADRVLKTLDTMTTAPAITLQPQADRIFTQLDRQFKTSTADISVPMTLSDPVARQIREEYTKNIDLDIQKWYTEQVERLRQQVQATTAEGFRADRVERILESEYGITKRKAKFLARQETSLFVSKFREARYTEAGIERYRWSTSHDERVRADHRALNDRTFSWGDPPIVDRATGKRGNPGEDFNCRCVAVPIVRRP